MSDSGGYQSDSDGYQSDSRGYQSDQTTRLGPSWPRDAHPELVKILERAAGARSDEWKTTCLDRWQHFAELVDAEYGDKLLVVHLWCEGILETDDRPPRKRAPAPALPPAKLPRDGDHARDALSYQVNIRLREWDYLRLAQAAGRYGVPATTLARLFITRGLEAAMREPADSD